MIGDVGDRRAVPLDAIAVGGPDVGHRSRRHLRVADHERLFAALVERERAGKCVHGHREVRRADAEVERLEQAEPVVLHRRVHVEMAALEERDEERQALHVIPMEVRDQRVAVERPVEGLGLAEVAQARAHVEDDRILAGGLNCHARGVAAVPTSSITRARCRPSHPEESDVEHRSPLGRQGYRTLEDQCSSGDVCLVPRVTYISHHVKVRAWADRCPMGSSPSSRPSAPRVCS